jgi:hypothetical protein
LRVGCRDRQGARILRAVLLTDADTLVCLVHLILDFKILCLTCLKVLHGDGVAH